MAERTVEVVSIDGARVGMRASGNCRGCLGCGGRCDLLRGWATDDRIELPCAGFPVPPSTGERWVIELDDAALVRVAARGYGLAWLGLLAGACAGAALAAPLGASPDLSTVLGALLGTLGGVTGSKRRSAAPAGLRVMRREPI